MTVHPFRPHAGSSPDTPDEPLLAMPGSPSWELPDAGTVFDELFDDTDESLNRYGALDRSNHLGHRVVTPTLLAGLTGSELRFCQAFHFVFFRLLEDVGDFDGLIATTEYYVDANSRRVRPADQWYAEHPPPASSDGSRPDREAVADHSLQMAAALGSNPSLTFGSMAAVVDQLVEELLELDAVGGSCSADHVEFLTSVSLVLLACTDYFVTIVGGVHVWAAEEPEQFGDG